jgi:hypothetical protein
MIEIADFRGLRRAARFAGRVDDSHKIDHRTPRPQLRQAQLILSPLDRAAEQPAVKIEHSAQVPHAQNEMINFPNLDQAATFAFF